MKKGQLDRAVGRNIFGADVEGYRSGRPDYPEEVYSRLREHCGLRPGARLFEIGPGTGQATERLLDFGVDALVAIEPDERLARDLQRLGARSDGRLEVRNEGFEESGLATEAFDLGVAATSFHWLDPQHALAKIMTLLKCGGSWAMWWNVFRDPTGGDTFGDAVQHIFHGIDQPPSFIGDNHYSLHAEDRLHELRQAGFADPHYELIRRQVTLTPTQSRALYATFSMIRNLPSEEAGRRLDAIEKVAEVEFDGIVERTFLTPFYFARRP